MSYMDNNRKRRTVDISSMDRNRREGAGSRKRFQDRYTLNLHVKHTRAELEKMVIPRGITLTIHPYSLNEQQQVEGTLITLMGTKQNPNVLCQREYNELQEFVNRKMKVLTDKPYELSQYERPIKIETMILNDSIARKAFNVYEGKEDGETYGEI